MLAWRLDLAHVDPLATFDVDLGRKRAVPPGGAGVPSRRSPVTGTQVSPPARARSSTTYCRPSQTARPRSGCRSSMSPQLTGAIGGPVVFTARLSSPLAWTFTVTASDGVVAFETAGEGSAVRVDWDTRDLPPGSYSWRLDAPGVTPAEGTLGAATSDVALTFTATSADPETIRARRRRDAGLHNAHVHAQRAGQRGSDALRRRWCGGRRARAPALAYGGRAHARCSTVSGSPTASTTPGLPRRRPAVARPPGRSRSQSAGRSAASAWRSPCSARTATAATTLCGSGSPSQRRRRHLFESSVAPAGWRHRSRDSSGQAHS